MFLTDRERIIIVGYDKQGLSFEDIAYSWGGDLTDLIEEEYNSIRNGIRCTLDNLALFGVSFNQIAVLSTTSIFSWEEASSCLTEDEDTWVIVPHYYAISELTSPITADGEEPFLIVPHNYGPLEPKSKLKVDDDPWMLVPQYRATSEPTSDTMAEEKPFIPMDDPRRSYKISGTNYAMCHPGLTGNWAGYKNTPEEQKAMDEFHHGTMQEFKHLTYDRLLGQIEAVKTSVNEKDEADRLLVEDLCRQQDELRAQREVERRVYYRQKALKEDRKKEKEEKARARAIARGEVVDDGEAVDGSSGRAQDSSDAMTGVIENGTTDGRDPGTEEGGSSAHGHGTNGGQTSTAAGTESVHGEAFGGEHAASDTRSSAFSRDQATT